MLLDGEYLGFLEKIEEHLDVEVVDGPDDEPLRKLWVIQTNPTRLRLSGLTARDFQDVDQLVTPLAGAPGPDARGLRLAQLREALRPDILPSIDIHLASWMPLTEQVLRTARLGDWYLFKVQSSRGGRRMAPVFFANPDAEAGRVARAFLASFDRAPDDLAVRLRDVFSLAHVGDWGTDEGSDGTPVAPPLEPLDGEGLLTIIVPRGYIEPKVEEEQPYQKSYSSDSGPQDVEVSS